MCGIAAAIGFPDAEAVVRRLLIGLDHRGDITDPPIRAARDIVMGTRRLRIVDRENATQPRLSYDDRILVAFNGEIYNHMALRQELERLGVTFRTQSDTEVLASALAAWGERALDRLNGMYAFVAFDLRTGQFLAARDPFGVKPLYFVTANSGWMFCSEMAPLLAATENGDVLYLPPGHKLTRTSFSSFRSVSFDSSRPRTRHDPKALDRLVAAAVEARIPEDLPFAIMFSGGIDSTLVAHYAHRVRADAPCYFLGGEQAPDHAFARDYATRAGIDLRHVSIESGSDTMSSITKVVAAVETFEPEVVRNSLCTYLLANRIHDDGFRVVLAGEGADELFAGYRPLEIVYGDSSDAGAFVRDQYVSDMHRTCLQRIDRCGMRFQIEVREPFLDPAIADYALGLEACDLVDSVGQDFRGKAPLRALFDLYPDDLPASIRDRRKVPLNEGAGFDGGPGTSAWGAFAEDNVSDADFQDGKRRFSAFDLRSKEEYLYLDRLAGCLDVTRVPHLTRRVRLRLPIVAGLEKLESFIIGN